VVGTINGQKDGQRYLSTYKLWVGGVFTAIGPGRPALSSRDPNTKNTVIFETLNFTVDTDTACTTDNDGNFELPLAFATMNRDGGTKGMLMVEVFAGGALVAATGGAAGKERRV
jgi:hypothetical protein